MCSKLSVGLTRVIMIIIINSFHLYEYNVKMSYMVIYPCSWYIHQQNHMMMIKLVFGFGLEYCLHWMFSQNNDYDVLTQNKTSAYLVSHNNCLIFPMKMKNYCRIFHLILITLTYEFHHFNIHMIKADVYIHGIWKYEHESHTQKLQK